MSPVVILITDVFWRWSDDEYKGFIIEMSDHTNGSQETLHSFWHGRYKRKTVFSEPQAHHIGTWLTDFLSPNCGKYISIFYKPLSQQ